MDAKAPKWECPHCRERALISQRIVVDGVEFNKWCEACGNAVRAFVVVATLDPSALSPGYLLSPAIRSNEG